MHNFLKGVQSMHTKIGKIRKMIETYVKNPNKVPCDPDLLKGKLPGGHHALRPHSVPEQIRAVIGVVGLGADMPFDFRADFTGNVVDARI